MRDNTYEKIDEAINAYTYAAGKKPSFIKKLLIAEKTIHDNTSVYLVRRYGINSKGKFYYHIHTTKVTKLR